MLITFLVLATMALGLFFWIGSPMKPRPGAKELEATRVIYGSIGTKGIWADPTRYRGQLWTRDFNLAMQPALFMILGGKSVALRHLMTIAKHQRADGKVPIVILDGIKGHIMFLIDKIWSSIKKRKMSFMLKAYLRGELADLTPGTGDSEIHFAAAITFFEQNSTSTIPSVLHQARNKALKYIKDRLILPNVLMMGADWRDTMEKELVNKTLLTNNSILYGVLKKINTTTYNLWADQILVALKSRDGGLMVDYEGAKYPDPLGISLAVLNGVIPPLQYDEALKKLKEVDSPLGVTIYCKHNPLNQEEAEVIQRTEGNVVCPFVVGYAVKAALVMGFDLFGDEQMDKFEKMEGLREWYDPGTGKGYGALLQGWSAALYLISKEGH